MTLTNEANKIFKALQSVELKGCVNFITGIRIAHVREEGGVCVGRVAMATVTMLTVVVSTEAPSEQEPEDEDCGLYWQSHHH